MRAELSGAPDALTVAGARLVGDNVEVQIACDRAKVKGPLAGNLILHVYGERDARSAKAKKANQRNFLGMLPAIPSK